MLTRRIDIRLQFYFTKEYLVGSKLRLVDYTPREPQQEAAKVSTYDKKIVVSKLDSIKSGAKRFLLKAVKFIDFASENHH